MMSLRLVSLAILLLCGAGSSHAQWIKYPSPGIPRKPDGSPSLTASAPRTADGKPDFSGVWGFDGGPSVFYIAGGLKPDEIQPWARETMERTSEHFGVDQGTSPCLPEGPTFNHVLAIPKKIVQTPDLMVVLSESLAFRQIFLDGRPLPEVSTPSFMGYSVGRWEGDTLVVETIGYNDRTRLDFSGHPHSEDLRLTERYRRLDFGHMEIQETFSDPAVYSRPLTVTVKATLMPDTEMLEFVCAENEKDFKDGHIVGTVSELMKSLKPVEVAPAILARYVGTYDFRWPENPGVPSLWTVTMKGGALFLDGAPLTPLSETMFLWGINRLEFVKNEQGQISHLIAQFVEGDLKVRKID